MKVNHRRLLKSVWTSSRPSSGYQCLKQSIHKLQTPILCSSSRFFTQMARPDWCNVVNSFLCPHPNATVSLSRRRGVVSSQCAVRTVVNIVRLIIGRIISCKLFVRCNDLSMDCLQFTASNAFVWPVSCGKVPIQLVSIDQYGIVTATYQNLFS